MILRKRNIYGKWSCLMNAVQTCVAGNMLAKGSVKLQRKPNRADTYKLSNRHEYNFQKLLEDKTNAFSTLQMLSLNSCAGTESSLKAWR